MNPVCPRCGARSSHRYGSYWRCEDARRISRYRCSRCGKCHSSATHTPTYRQQRRRLNRLIEAEARLEDLLAIYAHWHTTRG